MNAGTLITEKVIVLKVLRHGEGDLIIHTLNQNGCKLSFFAKSALQSRKRFGGGVLEPTHYIQVEYVKARGEDALNKLQSASLIKDFHKIRTDYDRLQLALYFVMQMEKIAHEGLLDHHELFDLLGNALTSVEVSQSLPLLKLHFEIKLLHILGVLTPFSTQEIWLTTPLSQHIVLSGTYETHSELVGKIHRTLSSHLT